MSAADDFRRLALGVLMPGFEGTTVPDWLAGPLRDGLASVCLFGMNVPDAATTARLVAELRALAPELVVAIDEESGDVTRLHVATGSPLPGNAALGVVGDPALARQAGAQVGVELAALGIDLDLAPVLDVASEPANPVIGTRSFGGSPELVTAMGRGFVAGLHDAGVAACGKHFPGHGDTAVDSHVGLPTIGASEELLRRRDLPPFLDLADELDAVMTAHILVPALGDGPASVSPWCYRLLRAAGFGGVAVTDALGMRAVSGDDLGPAVVQALAAGADLCCLDSPLGRDGRTAFDQAVCAVVDALDSGVLDPEALRASAERTRAMARRTAERRAAADPSSLPPADDEALGRSIADRAVVARGPMPDGDRVAFVDLRRRVNHAAGAQGQVLLDALREVFDEVVELAPGQEPPDGLPLVVQVRETLANPSEGRALADVLAVRPDAVVVHCGTADAAPAATSLVLAHGIGRPNARAAARLLAGGPR